MASKKPKDIEETVEVLDENTDKVEQTGNRIVNAVQFIWGFIPPIHKAGWPFVAIAGAIGVALWAFFDVFWLGLLLTVAVYLFFRDPQRFVPQSDHVLISPADGTVTAISKVEYPAELDHAPSGKVIRISVFLSVLDGHINRVPSNGVVKEVAYVPGKFINASLDKASEHNERSIALIESPLGEVGVVQIAGLIARRIINQLKAGDKVGQGDRYGLIRFGSRVDVYLPKGVEPVVSIGQRMVGGETVLAVKSGTSFEQLKTKII